MSEHDPRDLVVIALAGVQRFITESRTTADLRSASEIVAHLAAEAVRHLESVHNARIVFPSPTSEGLRGVDDGMPNRVVALLPPGKGGSAAANTKERLAGVWECWVREVFGRPMYQVIGWPVVQWVSVPAGVGSYEEKWEKAQRLLAERKAVRDFPQPWDEPAELCTLSPRWRSTMPPTAAPEHMENEKLAVANWVKRLWHRQTRSGRSSGFASTNAIASAPYRAEVLRRWDSDAAIPVDVRALFDRAAELGPDKVAEKALDWLPQVRNVDEAGWLRGRGSRWVFPSSWNLDALAHEFERDRNEQAFARTVREGWQAARRLEETMARHRVDPLSPHLAVLVQDLDSMGRFLSGRQEGRDREFLEVSEGTHADVSRSLSAVAHQQREAVSGAGGTVVYAGGDDLLALVPAALALNATRECQKAIPHHLPTASTGLLFFHHDSSLSQALRRARDLLDGAKDRPDKHSMGVGFVRHSGSHARAVLPWTREGAPDGSPDRTLRVFLPQGEYTRVHLSPQLLGDLSVAAIHLDGGDETTRVRDQRVLPPTVARLEMRRLVLRHTRLSPLPEGQPSDPQGDRDLRESFADQVVTALEHMAPGPRLMDESAVRVALFLRQET